METEQIAKETTTKQEKVIYQEGKTLLQKFVSSMVTKKNNRATTQKDNSRKDISLTLDIYESKYQNQEGITGVKITLDRDYITKKVCELFQVSKKLFTEVVLNNLEVEGIYLEYNQEIRTLIKDNKSFFVGQ